jgi:hypothetical protein
MVLRLTTAVGRVVMPLSTAAVMLLPQWVSLGTTFVNKKIKILITMY